LTLDTLLHGKTILVNAPIKEHCLTLLCYLSIRAHLWTLRVPDDGFGDLSNRLERLKPFFDAYGANRQEMIESVKLLPRRLLSLAQFLS
jgi:hypothetical protein